MSSFIRSLSTSINSSPITRAATSAASTHPPHSPIITSLSPSISKIQLIPSYPLYIAKGALLSAYATHISSISITNHYLHPLRRIVNGFHRFRFQKIESTIPSTLLISSALKKNSSSNGTQVLQLDGTRDWALLPRDALLAYSGAALRIETQLLPGTVDKKLKWWQFAKRINTGLKGPLRPGYSLVSGRGTVVVKGEGELYVAELKEDEEFLVKRGNIVGISINGDLAESTETYELNKITGTNEVITKSDIEVEEQEKVIIPDDSTTDIVIEKKNPVDYLKQVKNVWKSVTSGFWKSVYFINETLPSNNEYVKITGPRSVIIKSQVEQVNFLKLKEQEHILKKE